MAKRDEAPLGAPCSIELFTSDVPAARAFYHELFGWTSAEPDPNMGGYFNFEKDGVLVAGGMGNDGSAGIPDVWNTYLAVADADATAAAVKANGGGIHFDPMDVMDMGRMSMATDPGGATIGIWQPGTHKGFGVLAEPGSPGWFELHTRDYDASVAFYREVFGWDTHVASDTPEFRYTTLGEGDGQLAGMMDSSNFLPEGVGAFWAIYFVVDDTDTSVAKAVELGATVTEAAQDTPFGRLASLTDPTGTAFKLTGMQD